MQFLFRSIQSQLPVLYLENLHAKLLHTDNKIVRHCISSVKCLAILWHIRRLPVRPLIIFLCSSHYSFYCLKILQRNACRRRKRLPVRFIDHHDLCGLRCRKDSERTVGGDTPLLYVGIYVFL